jgi:hypothetical protein
MADLRECPCCGGDADRRLADLRVSVADVPRLGVTFERPLNLY